MDLEYYSFLQLFKNKIFGAIQPFDVRWLKSTAKDTVFE